METKQEAVTCVYRDKVLIAIVLRSDITRKHEIKMVRDAKTDDIAKLLTNTPEL